MRERKGEGWREGRKEEERKRERERKAYNHTAMSHDCHRLSKTNMANELPRSLHVKPARSDRPTRSIDYDRRKLEICKKAPSPVRHLNQRDTVDSKARIGQKLGDVTSTHPKASFWDGLCPGNSVSMVSEENCLLREDRSVFFGLFWGNQPTEFPVLVRNSSVVQQ